MLLDEVIASEQSSISTSSVVLKLPCACTQHWEHLRQELGKLHFPSLCSNYQPGFRGQEINRKEKSSLPAAPQKKERLSADLSVQISLVKETRSKQQVGSRVAAWRNRGAYGSPGCKIKRRWGCDLMSQLLENTRALPSAPPPPSPRQRHEGRSDWERADLAFQGACIGEIGWGPQSKS